MINFPFDSIDQVDDVNTKGEYAAALAAGLAPAEALARVAAHSRDNARTPVQWSAAANAGFTAGTPWLAVNPGYRLVNAAAQRGVPGSVFEFYKTLIKLRKDEKYKEALVWGSFAPWRQELPGLAAFIRSGGGRTLLVAANLKNEPQPLALPAGVRAAAACSEGAPKLAGASLTLDPWQAVVLELEG